MNSKTQENKQKNDLNKSGGKTYTQQDKKSADAAQESTDKQNIESKETLHKSKKNSKDSCCS